MNRNEKDIKKELLGIKFTRFDVNPIKRHPLADETDKWCETKFEELGISSLFERDTTDWVYLLYPYVSNPQVLHYLVLHVLYIFKVDDFLDDEEYPNSKENWNKYLLEKTCPGDNEVEKLYLAMIEQGRKCFTEEQLDAIFDKLIKWFDCSSTVHKVLNNELKLTDEEYMKVRLLDITIYSFLYAYAFGFGISVEELDNNKICQQMMSETIKDIIIANELYSLRKEVIKGVMKWNYVYIKMQNHNVSAQKATEMLMNEMVIAKSKAMALASQLKSGKDINMAKFANAIESIIDGNRYWSWICKRYNGIHLYQ